MTQEGAKARRFEDCSSRVIGACIEVHRQLGPGLLESVYEECVAAELTDRGLRFERQPEIPVVYKGRPLGFNLRADLIVENEVLVEVKAVESLLPVHKAQTISYLRMTGTTVGLLVNFNVDVLRHGLRRFVLHP